MQFPADRRRFALVLARTLPLVVLLIAVPFALRGDGSTSSASPVELASPADDVDHDGQPDPATHADATVEHTPADQAEARSEAVEPPSRLSIVRTGGRGVRLRNDCDEAATTGGSWSEGTRELLVERGVGDCEGWSVFAVGSVQSWVENSFIGPAGSSTVAKPPQQPAINPGAPLTPTPTPPMAAPEPGEFEVAVFEFSLSSVGVASVDLTVQNVSESTIEGYAIDICFFDAAGDPVAQGGHGPSCVRSTHEVQVLPGATHHTGGWTLYGYGQAATARAIPWFARTDDGGYWRP